MKIDLLLKKEIQAFIIQNLNRSISELLLTKNPFPELAFSEIAHQIKGRKTAEKKWPFLLKDAILFPPHLNLEQASSETTARFKKQFYRGQNFLDLTCGFGIDAYFLAQNFENRHLVEQNQELLSIVEHNWGILEQKAYFYCQKLENFLDETPQSFDLIYLDPARRDENLRKKVFLEDLSPNLIEWEENLLNFSPQILVKLSPMMDLTAINNQLKWVCRMDVVSVKNEVKEILVHLNKTKKQQNCPIFCHNLETQEPSIGLFLDEAHAMDYSEVLNYVQIPNSSLMKLGKFTALQKQYSLKKLHPNSHLFTSENWVENFPGRQFRVQIVQKCDIEPQSKYNLIIRNYPLSDIEIKKKYRILDGGKNYLIFTQTQSKKIILKSY